MSGKKYFVLLLVVFTLLILSVIPCVGDMEAVSVSRMNEYPIVEKAYSDHCNEYSSDRIEVHDTFYIVPVSNLWGRWERYILLCHTVDTPDVPAEGAVQFSSQMHILAPWSKENIFTDICRLKVRDYYQRIEPGAGVILTGFVKFTHSQLMPAAYLSDDLYLFEDEALICDDVLTISTEASMVSNLLSDTPPRSVTTNFYFEYILRMFGKRLCVAGYPVSSDHLVNTK